MKAGRREGERRTSNVQRPTSKERKSKVSVHFDVGRWTLDVRRSNSNFNLSIANTTTARIDAFITRHLQSAHAILHPPLTELSLALIGDQKMSALHQQFLGIPGPTDVLTFPLELNKKGQPLTAEVVICVPEARRRCKENGGKLREELLLYALHGLLHLCGFDDRTEREFRRMHRKEDEILDQLGVGRVFERD